MVLLHVTVASSGRDRRDRHGSLPYGGYGGLGGGYVNRLHLSERQHLPLPPDVQRRDKSGPPITPYRK